MTTLVSTGCYAKKMTKSSFKGRPCLFLDRDGVIVEETNYLHRIEDVRIIPGVGDAIARVNDAGVPVVMVTNQAGIGRGYYRWSEFDAVQEHILSLLERQGAHFEAVFACAYHADGIDAYAVADHPWRKPADGMLREAEAMLGVDLAQSFIVGDTLTDMQAGAAAGLKRGAFVRTGHGTKLSIDALNNARIDLEAIGFGFSVEANAGSAVARWLNPVMS